jgi:hypothetical protein
MTEFITATALIAILTFSSISGANQLENPPKLTPAVNSTKQTKKLCYC